MQAAMEQIGGSCPQISPFNAPFPLHSSTQNEARREDARRDNARSPTINQEITLKTSPPKLSFSLSPPHAVQGSYEVILVELVLVSQQGTLLQGYRHRRPVFGTFTAGEPDPVQPSADLDQGRSRRKHLNNVNKNKLF